LLPGIKYLAGKSGPSRFQSQETASGEEKVNEVKVFLGLSLSLAYIN
jgi:hypothetical protein